jgi:hypothetical protein
VSRINLVCGFVSLSVCVVLIALGFSWHAPVVGLNFFAAVANFALWWGVKSTNNSRL